MPGRISTGELTDQQLLILSRNEDDTAKEAFEILYNRYRVILINAAYKRLQSKQRAEDLVQDLFLSIYQRRNSLEINASFSAYIHKALKFTVLNEIRSMIVRDRYNKSHFFNDTYKTDFSEAIDARQLDLKIRKVINTLPEKCRKTFLLSREENLSYSLISQQLQISVSTVEKHIVKALKVMRGSLREFA